MTRRAKKGQKVDVIGYRGSATRAQPSKVAGVEFFSADPKIANHYATNYKSLGRPVPLDPAKTYYQAATGEVASFQNRTFTKPIRSGDVPYADGASITRERVQMKYARTVDAKSLERLMSRAGAFDVRDVLPGIVKSSKARGYDGLVLKDVQDIGGRQTQYVTFSKSQTATSRQGGNSRMADLPRDTDRAARVRSAKRASDVIDRAARMKQFKAPLVERISRPFDPQMKTPGYDANALRPDRVDGASIKRLGMVEVPVNQIRTAQPSVSVAASKAKIGGSSRPPQLVKRPDGTWSVLDGNHTITAARATNAQTVKAYGGVIPGDRGGPFASGLVRTGNAYQAMSPYLQAAGVIAGASTAYRISRENNGTRMEALNAAGKVAAPAVGLAAGAAIASRVAPAVGSALAKANPAIFAASLAYGIGKGAWDGYNAPDPSQRTWGQWATGQSAPKAGWKGALKGAAFGAADTLTFGLASAAAGRDWNVKGGGGIGFDPWKPRFTEPTQKRSDAGGKSYASADQAFTQKRDEPVGPTRGAYKDTWTDTRGRNYTRKNMAVRTRADMKEAA